MAQRIRIKEHTTRARLIAGIPQPDLTVLLVQDTRMLNYKGLSRCMKTLGTVGCTSGSADGLFVHAGPA